GNSNVLNYTASGGAPGTVFCVPGADVGNCVCNNANGGAGLGCMNTSGVGAGISGAGSASVASDTLVLSANGMNTSAFSIFIQGNALAAGSPFFSGLRCAGGGLVRLLPVSPVSGGNASYPAGAQVAITVASANATPAQ